MTDEFVIGIDLGGTRIRAGRFTPDLDEAAYDEVPTDGDEGKDAVIGRMVEKARAVFPSSGGVQAIGVSAPGPIDLKNGVITHPPNLKGWVNVPLRDILQERLGAPVFLGNDANLAALAEYRRHASTNDTLTDLIYLTISTGIGAGVIIDGRLLIGADGLGAECGHLMMVVEGDEPTSFEKEASGTAIAHKAQMAIEAGAQSIVPALAEAHGEEISAKHVAEAARRGDTLAGQIMTRTGTILGLGIVSLLHTFNPQMVVIGGSVYLHSKDLLYAPMWGAIKANVLGKEYWQRLEIVDSMGDKACLVGAAALAARR